MVCVLIVVYNLSPGPQGRRGGLFVASGYGTRLTTVGSSAPSESGTLKGSSTRGSFFGRRRVRVPCEELRRLGLTCDLAAARLVKTGLPAFSFMIRKQMPTSKMKIPTTTTAATMMRYRMGVSSPRKLGPFPP